jgi:hypothetical protein
VARQALPAARVVVVGNRTPLPELPAGVDGVELSENLGVSGGRNAAIAHLRACGDAQAREQASTSSGMTVEVTAHFVFTCTGSSDDGRERSITTAISPTYEIQILVAEAITESYFTEWGTRAVGVRADFTHVSTIEFRF